MKTYSTTLREVFTTDLDPFTGGKFQGNHRDFFASFKREGDKLTVSRAWVRDSAGTFFFREEETFSISAMLEGLKESAAESGVSFECSDNLPEGFSLAIA